MKKIFSGKFIIIALLFHATTIQASTEDSLKNVIANTDGIEKLEALTNLMRLKVAGKDAIEYAISLEEEARKQNNDNFIGNALAVKAMIYFNQLNNEKFVPAAEEAKVYLIKKKQLDRYFAVCNFEIKKHLLDGYFETAFLKISTMLNEAKDYNNIIGEINVYETMGDAYYVEKHFQKALESYQKMLSLLNTHYPELTINRAEIGLKIVDNANKIGDIPLTLLYCDSIRQIVEEFDQTKSKKFEHLSTNYIKLVLYMYYALAYISVDREKEATDAHNIALKHYDEEVFDSYRQTFYFLCSDYYFKKGENRIALEYLKKSEELASSYDSSDSDVMLMKSKIFVAMGNFEEAYNTEMANREQADSLNQRRLSQRISELRTIHQVEKLEFQAKQEQLKSANLWLFIMGLIVIVLLLGCVLVSIIYNSNKIKQKNRVLYQHIQSHEVLELELKTKNDQVSDDEADQLYLCLKEFMKDEKNFTDPSITRKTLATKLGTNEKYLHETIKKNLNLSFTEYINLLRLDYARDMMTRHQNKLALEDIAMMSGFGTRQTFHRLFRDKYGLSPFEYSNFLKNS